MCCSSIARFDPEEDWPTDVAVSVTLNSELRTYDGEALSTPASASYSTPPLSFAMATVESPLLHNVTSGRWSGSVAPLRDGAVESPPDGIVRLRFGSAVDEAAVARALVLRGAASGVTVTAAPCRDVPTVGSSSGGGYWDTTGGCVAAMVRGLATDAVVSLVLPRGTRYHPRCGGSAADVVQLVTGAVSFSFPFLYTTTPPEYARASSRRMLLWVRHGLASTTATAVSNLQVRDARATWVQQQRALQLCVVSTSAVRCR